MSDSRGRILFVYDGKMNKLGCDLSTHHMLIGLVKAGYTVDFISRGRVDIPGVRSIRHRLLAAKLFSSFSARTYGAVRRRYVSWLGKRMLDRNPDYVCVMAWAQSCLAMFQRAGELGIPRILHSGNNISPRTMPEHLSRRWPAVTPEYKYAEYQLCSGIAVISEACKQTYVEAGIPAERVCCIGRGADLSAYYPPEKPPEKFIALFCGAIGDRKGALQVLKAWREAALSDAELWFLGKVQAQIRDEFNALLDDSVKVLGHRDDVPDLMRSASIQFMLSSNDGPAKAFLEGAACGLASITTPESNFPVDGGRIGFHVGREDQAASVEKLRFLHANPKALQTMREAAADYAKQHFSWDAVHQQMGDCVTACIERETKGAS
ncbi:MAG: glycosyltransferase family 4 protein [Gammaproteobacteria bacterium]